MGRQAHFVIFGTGGAGNPLLDELAQLGHTSEIRVVRVLRPSFGREVRRCDIVLDIGEGDSFSDIYGFKRFWYLWLSKLRVTWNDVPIVLAPQTIGPFSKTPARLLAAHALRRAARIFARDTESMALLRSMGVARFASEVIDVAFALPYSRSSRAPSSVVRVGVNASALLFNGGYTRRNQFALKTDYVAFVHGLIECLLKEQGVEVHLIPHVVPTDHPVEDDYDLAQRLKAEYPALHIAPRFARPGTAKDYIGQMDFFTGARMHACIAAFSAGVPVVPLAYSRKFGGLFSTLDYHRVADGRTLGTAEAVAVVMNGFHFREALRAEVNRGQRIAETRLADYQRELTLLLERVAS
jgi:polysaccharide pyruvyl transferase WcaK-like protein